MSALQGDPAVVIQSWLDEDRWNAMMDGLVRARYSLLLGAGASVGSTNSKGDPLPVGGQLRGRLIENYQIPVDEGGDLPSLRNTYDLAVQVAEFATKEQPMMYLRRMFTDCTVPEWYRHVVRIPWNIIWNLNVDDVLENAYHARFGRSAVQKLSITSWDNPRPFHREEAAAVTGVHLHGRAKESNMIFGSVEYLTAIDDRGPGHELFKQTWSVNPVVVVGASLGDEIDMSEALLRPRAQKANEPPSVVVLKSISQFDRFRLDKSGLTAIEASGEEFFSAVHADWDAATARLDQEAQLRANGVDSAAGYFLRHFRDVDIAEREDPRHDFYSGHEPTWADVNAGLDIHRRLNLASPLDEFQRDKVRVLAIHGGPLSGKSTVELRFAAACLDAGMQCSRYDGGRTFDVEALFWYFKRNARGVLFVDDLVDFRGELEKLSQMCAESSVGMRIVTTVRDTRLHLLSSIDDDHLRLVRVADRITDNEIRDLISKLEQNHRSNILADLKDYRQRFNFFKIQNNSYLVAGLESATRGRGFAERIRSNYDLAVNSGSTAIATIILLSAEVGYPVELGTIAAVAKVSAAEIRDRLQKSNLGDLAREDASGNVRPRQPGLAARVFRENVPEDDRFTVALDVAHALAPSINPLTISFRTRYARFGGQLMSARRIMNWLSASRVDNWFAELEDVYQWNARYWEQRALAECIQEAPRYERAEAWARESTRKYEDAYSLNTLAKVLFRRALMSSHEIDDDLFDEALSVVRRALESLDRSSEYPYITALTYLTNALEMTNQASSRGVEYRRQFNSWMREAEDAEAFRFSRSRELLTQRHKAFLKVIAGDSAPNAPVFDDQEYL